MQFKSNVWFFRKCVIKINNFIFVISIILLFVSKRVFVFESLYVCLSERIPEFGLKSSISHELIILVSWYLAHLSTLGCNHYADVGTVVNSCFSHYNCQKSTLEVEHTKVCLAKCVENSLGYEFGVLKLFCSSKTVWFFSSWIF